MMNVRRERTVSDFVELSGIGVHTGHSVTIRLIPQERGGIRFRRVDLPEQPEIPATIDFVIDTKRSTSLGQGDVSIHTVEHLLAALKSYCIDHLLIEINSIEPPIGDGSAKPFVEMIEQVGTQELDSKKPVVCLDTPLYYSSGETQIVALPSNVSKISYTLSYPGGGPLEAQFFSTELDEESFSQELAPARTFSRYEEVSTLIDHGLIKGGSLKNSIIVKDDAVLSHEGLRFPNEMARHKIIDMIGDLSLVPVDLVAHLIAIRSGHQANFAFAQLLSNYLHQETLS